MGLIVRRSGTFSLIVDGGRVGTRHVGLPRGGPADEQAWVIGNALVGNFSTGDGSGHNTAIEVALQGPVLEATSKHTMVVYGAPYTVMHRPATVATSRVIPAGHVFTVDAGDELMIQGNDGKIGLRCYLCVQGGLQTPLIAGSRSGLEPVKLGQTLHCHPSERAIRHRWVKLESWPEEAPKNTLRVLAGTHLSKKVKPLLLETKFTILPDSNRMGLRLNSNVKWPSDGKELVSAPVTPGTLQLPTGGQPILLGVDAQTIGGYPRLAHVISADLDRLGQLRPGEYIRFSLVNLDEAERLERSRLEWLRTWLQRIRWAV